METHCLAQPFSCLGYEKAGEPSATPPPSRAPSSFLPLFHPLCIAVGHPRTNITLHQLGYFHFAHSAILLAQLGSIGRAQSIFFLSVFMFLIAIFLSGNFKKKSSVSPLLNSSILLLNFALNIFSTTWLSSYKTYLQNITVPNQKLHFMCIFNYY